VTGNATSTEAIWTGTAGSLWGYRREMGSAAPRMYLLVIPSLVGGITGTLLLRWTPTDTFDRLAPFLILFATTLFMAQEPLQRALETAHAESHHSITFGILMLAALAIIGLTDIHQMNGLKVVFAMCINGIAAVYFGRRDWSTGRM
jgi:uncharacterized membrane protein YfcA